MFNKQGIYVQVTGDMVTTTAQGCALSKETIQSIGEWTVKVKSDPYGYSSIGIAKSAVDLNSFVGAGDSSIGLIPNSAVMQGSQVLKYGLAYGVGDKINFRVEGKQLVYNVNGYGRCVIDIPKGKWMVCVGASSGGCTSHKVTFGETSLLEKVKAWFKGLV